MVQVKAGKAVAAEQGKWQANGKALPVEMVPTASQTNHAIEKVKGEVAEVATQTEVGGD